MHHEQACAMAAEGYARIAGKPAVVMLTTGPGAINALNGVFGAFTDSIPMLVLSGQVKTTTCKDLQEIPSLRQLGANFYVAVLPGSLAFGYQFGRGIALGLTRIRMGLYEQHPSLHTCILQLSRSVELKFIVAPSMISHLKAPFAQIRKPILLKLI
jgi:Flp pilus assembly pilin Flp